MTKFDSPTWRNIDKTRWMDSKSLNLRKVEDYVRPATMLSNEIWQGPNKVKISPRVKIMDFR